MSSVDNSQPNGASGPDELTVTAVLTQDPGMLREMLFAQMEISGNAIARKLAPTNEGGGTNTISVRIFEGKAYKRDIESLRHYIDDLNECVAMLGQVGWRRQKGER
jgi:hypothetical protein